MTVRWMRGWAGALSLLGLLAIGGAKAAVATPDYASGVLLVQFTPGADSVMTSRILARHGLRIEKVLKRLNVLRVRLPAGQDERVIAGLLSRYPLVAFAEPDYIRHARRTPSDPRYFMQWDMNKIRLPEAWNITRGSSSVVVAILDTGMDLSHPDLVGGLWRNSDEVAGNGWDDDGNGYVDDINGYDFAGNGRFPGVSAEDPVPNDTNDHGTHVAGTVGARADNGIGISGVAPLVRLMIVKVLGGILGSGYSSDIIDGIVYATDNGAQIINMSLGGTSASMAEATALRYAWDRGVFIAAAAGNAGDGANPIEYPAGYMFTMSVAATDQNDYRAYFSTYNSFVEIAAPGVDIHSTVPGGGYEEEDWSGTSMACPHIAGMAALLKSHQPNIANWEIRAMLQDSAADLGTLGWDMYHGHGRADAAALLARQRPSTQTLRILTPPMDAHFVRGTVVQLLWTPVSGATDYRVRATLPNGSQQSVTTSTPYYYVPPATRLPEGWYGVTVEARSVGGGVLSSDYVTLLRLN